MTFDEYQKQSIKTAVNATDDFVDAFLYRVLGLTNEAGEVAGKVKKIIRDKNKKLSDEDKIEIAKELGDVLWYLSVIAHYLDVPLNKVAQDNLDKLFDRKARGKISGSGDNR
jgi:NTP pyrophosphatase (non-canonical NTP hydrolase)